MTQHTVAQKLAALIAVATVLAATFGCLAFGATRTWSAAVLELLCVVVGILWLIGGGRGGGVLAVLALPAMIGVIQLAPLPAWLGSLAPLSSRAWAKEGSFHVSLDLGATVSETVRLFLLALVCVAVGMAARHEKPRRVIIAGVAVVGVMVLVLGLVFPGDGNYTALGFHDMTGPIRPWKSSLLEPLHSAGMGYPDTIGAGDIPYTLDGWVVGDVYGPYVNSNHFGNALALTIPVAAGLLLAWATHGKKRGVAIALACLLGAGAVATTAFGAHAWAAGMLLVLALLLLGAFAIGQERGWRTVLRVTIFGLCALVLISAITCGVAKSVNRDLPQRVRASVARRLESSRAGVRMFKANAPAGVGLGAYRACYPGFAETPPTMAFAHNEYAQYLAETGITGLLAIVPILLLIVRRTMAALRRATQRAERLVLIAVLLALCAMIVHSAVDYNLHVPANAFLFAVLLGLVFGMGAPEETAEAPEPGATERRRAWILRGALGLLLLPVTVVAAGQLYASGPFAGLRSALTAHVRDRVVEKVEPDDAQLRDAVARGQGAFAAVPWDADAAELIGCAWLEVSRGESAAELDRGRFWLDTAARLRPVSDAAAPAAKAVEDALRR